MLILSRFGRPGWPASLMAFGVLTLAPAAISRAVAGRPEHRPPSHAKSPPAGFAVVPDPSWEAIEFEPNGPVPVPPAPQSAARDIPVAAAPPSLPSLPSAPPPVPAGNITATGNITAPGNLTSTGNLTPTGHLTVVADQPPPVSILVTFPNNRIAAKAKADLVAALLRARGLQVEERQAERPGSARARILFAFEEDRAGAAAINRTLRAAYGLDSPMTLSTGADAAPPPGAIEIALPG